MAVVRRSIAGTTGAASEHCVAGGNAMIQPARDELLRQAAQGEVLHNDDSGMPVLQLAREPSDQRTGPTHAGENLA
jgi:hypothetical protein